MMDASGFIDYYRIMGVAPGISGEELGRRFHRLAKRFHPDNPLTGNRDLFDQLVTAHGVLKDPVKRAEFDLLYDQVMGPRPSPAAPEAVSDAGTVAQDVRLQTRLLSVFYTRRRRTIRDPGVPDMELERIFGCPIEDLEFHLWYLKAKGWVEKLENGMLAITVAGVDHVNAEHQRHATTMLLLDRPQDDGLGWPDA